MILNITAPELFAQGHDTADIALMLDMSEPQVLRLINIKRSERKGLLSPYPQRGTSPYPSSRRLLPQRQTLLRVQ